MRSSNLLTKRNSTQN